MFESSLLTPIHYRRKQTLLGSLGFSFLILFASSKSASTFFWVISILTMTIQLNTLLCLNGTHIISDLGHCLRRVLQSVFLSRSSRFLCLRRRRILLFAKQSCEHSLYCPFRLTDCRKKSGRFWCSSYTRLSNCANVILTLTEMCVSFPFSMRRCLCNPCCCFASPRCG